MTDDDIVTAALDLARSVDHYEEVIISGGQYADGVIEECFSLLLEYRDKLRGVVPVRTAAIRDADELASYRDAAKAAYDNPTPVAAPPETGVIPIPPGWTRSSVPAWQDAYEVMETSGEAHAAVSAPPLTRDDAEIRISLVDLRAELIAKSGYGRITSEHVSREDLRRWAGVIETALGLDDE